MKILVVNGGTSPERNVSLASGEAVAAALKKGGHDVSRLDPLTPGHPVEVLEVEAGAEIESAPGSSSWREPTVEEVHQFADRVTALRPDLVYISLHGGWGENGLLQGLLDLLVLPYSGSGVLASAAAMDKQFTRQLADRIGITIPEGSLIKRGESAAGIPDYGFPVVVKPNAMGSTLGLCIAGAADERDDAVRIVLEELHDDCLLEQYIPGSEITCTVLNEKALPLVEIKPQEGFYDYANKYTTGRTEYLVPAPLADELTARIQREAVAICRALQIEVLARVDYRVTPEGYPFFLEVNSSPGMTEASLVPKAAAAVGISFEQLVEQVVELSLKKRSQESEEHCSD